MKFLSLIGLLLLSCTVVAQSEQEEILAVLEAQRTAWNQGDLPSYMQGYWQSADLTFVGKSGIKRGWQETLANYQKSYPDKAAMGQLTFNVLQVEVQASSAFMLGQWSLQRSEDNPHGHFTLFWKKIDGHWKVVIDHSS